MGNTGISINPKDDHRGEIGITRFFTIIFRVLAVIVISSDVLFRDAMMLS